MLRALLLLYFTALAIGNPFHKYPYVFLLDVGNEELDKVNTEQIRITKQGGSLALRYPAIGNGEDIAHVRVSGIDFGTDLKADIVDGGPGYKYVVLVLMGNQGVSFDAVVTIQTVPGDSEENLQSIDGSSVSKEEIDPNDSAEDLSDDGNSEEASQIGKKDAELSQESSNVYYAVNEALSGYGDSIHSSQDNVNEQNDDLDNKNDNEQDINIQNNENGNSDESYANQNEEYSPKNSQDQDNDEEYNDQNYAPDIQEQASPYEYREVRPYYNSAAFQSALPDQSNIVYVEEPNDNNALNLDELFSDEYDEDDGNVRQYSDKNNNFIDRNDGSAVAY